MLAHSSLTPGTSASRPVKRCPPKSGPFKGTNRRRNKIEGQKLDARRYRKPLIPPDFPSTPHSGKIVGMPTRRQLWVYPAHLR